MTIARPAMLFAALALCAAPALAQQKQKITYKVDAADAKYPQRLMIEVGDQPGHTVGAFEIHRKFGAGAPSINGVKIKESFTRGYNDYYDSNGLSVNYTVFVMENGDKFYSHAHTVGQADAAGKRSTVSVGDIRGGTGKLAGIKGITRSKGASDGKAGFNQTESEIEYWFEK